jgi:hypothetical protein
MASRIVRDAGAFYIPKRKNMKNDDLRGFLKSLPCVVTLRAEVEVAHISAASIKHGHFGRAKSQKASDRFALPLHHDQHRLQHNFPGGEMAYWESVQIDPYGLSLSLSGLYFEVGDYARDECEIIIRSRLWRS